MNQNNLTEEDIRELFGAEHSASNNSQAASAQKSGQDQAPAFLGEYNNQIIPPSNTQAPQPINPIDLMANEPSHDKILEAAQSVKIEYSPEITNRPAPEKIVDHQNYVKSVKKRLNGTAVTWIIDSLKTLAFFIIIFTLSFVALNFPAIFIKSKYFVQVEQGGKTWAADPLTAQMLSKDNNLYIPKIAIDVPVSWNVSDANTLPALENGVAHYLGTALPGQPGNVFISGHSSFYWWNKGSFKEIFALLDKMQIGDNIYISYHGALYTYRVIDKKTVKPSDMSVLNQTNTKTLSLMTCVPVGTNLNRLIVTAQQI